MGTTTIGPYRSTTVVWNPPTVFFRLVVQGFWKGGVQTLDWNGMDYWNGLQGSNSQLFFHTLSNRVSIASHTAMKMHGKLY